MPMSSSFSVSEVRSVFWAKISFLAKWWVNLPSPPPKGFSQVDLPLEIKGAHMDVQTYLLESQLWTLIVYGECQEYSWKSARKIRTSFTREVFFIKPRSLIAAPEQTNKIFRRSMKHCWSCPMDQTILFIMDRASFGPSTVSSSTPNRQSRDPLGILSWYQGSLQTTCHCSCFCHLLSLLLMQIQWPSHIHKDKVATFCSSYWHVSLYFEKSGIHPILGTLEQALPGMLNHGVFEWTTESNFSLSYLIDGFLHDPWLSGEKQSCFNF